MAQYSAAVARNTQAMPARTPAEQALIDAFERQNPANDAGWLPRIRREAMTRFAEAGLPTARLEAWRYTSLRDRLKDPVAPLDEPAAPITAAAIEAALGPLSSVEADRLVLVDGRYRPELSRHDQASSAIEVMPLAPLLGKAPAWLEAKFAPDRLAAPDTVIALNTAFMTDGLMVKIKPGQQTVRPLLIVMVRASATPALITTRNIIAVEQGSRATILEAHITLPGAAPSATINALSDVVLDDGSALDHIKLATEHGQTNLLTHWGVRIGASATYRAYHLTLGDGLVRHGIAALMAGSGSTIDLTGAFLGDRTSHTDTTMLIDHQAPSCTSRELFKGVLAGKARGIFQGKVVVRPAAQKTDGKQMAQALLLSEDAEFDSKPELEIYADDVACGHGSTSAEIDDDHIFYLRARGIPESEARVLLTRAFVAETLDRIADEALRTALADVMDTWLEQRAAQWAGERT